MTSCYRLRIRYRSLTIRDGTRQANLDMRHDRDWSNSSSGERQRGGELHKARYKRGWSGNSSWNTSRAHLARGSSQARGYRRCQEGLLDKSPDYRSSWVTSNVSWISIQFHLRNKIYSYFCFSEVFYRCTYLYQCLNMW